MTDSYAWWRMARKEKDLLREQRLMGMFGGVPGGAPYFWVQEGSTPEGAEGAAKAGIKPTHFVESALNDSEEAIWAGIEGAIE